MSNGDFAVLKNSNNFALDLNIAVFLAQASQAAYSEVISPAAWAIASGFPTATLFDRDNVQGFWCAVDDVALLVFRGTSNPGQWLRDARFFPARYPWGKVHVGFRDGVQAVEPDLSDFDGIAAQAKHVWVTGHSLGGALSLLAAARLKMRGISTTVYTYGQPRVGLDEFAERYESELPLRLIHFVNQSDIVTRVPPDPFYRHTGMVKRIVRPGVLESVVASEATSTLPDLPVANERFESLIKVLGGGGLLESVPETAGGLIEPPTLSDQDAPSLTDLEFAELQFGLGAGAKSALGAPVSPELDEAQLEGIFSPFSDHSISEYIRLLEEIRIQPD